MPQNPSSNLTDTLKKNFVQPVQNALNAVDRYVPDWLPGVKSKPSPGADAAHDADVKKANESLGITNDKPLPSQSAPKPKSVPKYHEGSDYVPETGKAVLKKGEAVLNTEDANKLREAKGKGMNTSSAVKSVASELGGKTETPKKEIKHIITRKAHGGKGHIHTHVHTHAAHPDEEHVTSGDDEMAEHMMQHMGEPNPGEAEADAGQSGIPAAGAAPQPGAAAPGAGTPPPPVTA